VRYDATGQPHRWLGQPLVWALAFLTVSLVTQVISALLRLSAGHGWFDSASGQQAPVLLVVAIATALVGLSRKSDRG
jgi:hypothetical protein